MTDRPRRVPIGELEEEEPMPVYVSGTRPSTLPRTGEADQDASWRWWDTPYGGWRLQAEIEAMRRFPDFRLSGGGLGRLSWRGHLHSSLDPERRYRVVVEYPDRFPDEVPDVRILEPELPSGVPHLLSGGRPCLYRPTHGPRHGYDPARTTAATLVAWTALWIHAYETWQATGAWPGRAE